MDPFEAPSWNFLQLLAWVYRRDPSDVRDFADDRASEGTVWAEVKQPDGRQVMVDQDIGPPSSLSIAARDAARGNAQFSDIKAAETKIWEELVMDRLKCSAVRSDDCVRQGMAAELWSDLCFSERQGEYRAVQRHYTSLHAPSWHRLRFPRQQILALWPKLAKNDDDAGQVELRDQAPVPKLGRPFGIEYPHDAAIIDEVKRLRASSACLSCAQAINDAMAALRQRGVQIPETHGYDRGRAVDRIRRKVSGGR